MSKLARTSSRRKHPAHRKVGRLLIEAITEVAEQMQNRDPVLRERWLDQCRTSKASDREGLVLLTGEYDWPIAFVLWNFGYGSKLPREPE